MAWVPPKLNQPKAATAIGEKILTHKMISLTRHLQGICHSEATFQVKNELI